MVLGPAAAKSDYYFHRSAQNSGEMFLPLLSECPNTKKFPGPAGNKFLCTSDNQVCSAGLCRGWILGPGFGDFLDLQSHSSFQEHFPGEEQAVPWDAEGMEAEAGKGICFPPCAQARWGTAPAAAPEIKGVTFAPTLGLFGAPFMPLHPLGGTSPFPTFQPDFQSLSSSTRL